MDSLRQPPNQMKAILPNPIMKVPRKDSDFAISIQDQHLK